MDLHLLHSAIADGKRNISLFALGQAPVHLIYRLYGSIPQAQLQRIGTNRSIALSTLERKLADVPSRYKTEWYAQEIRRLSYQSELALERALHDQNNKPYHLQNSELRDIVLDSWGFFHTRREIELYAVCVMSNHVHVVLAATSGSKNVDLGRLMDRHKTYTARCCNQAHNTVGKPFWASNYFDRTIRDDQFLTTMWYVLNNPVKLGLVKSWEQWPGTFLNPRYRSHFVY